MLIEAIFSQEHTGLFPYIYTPISALLTLYWYPLQIAGSHVQRLCHATTVCSPQVCLNTGKQSLMWVFRVYWEKITPRPQTLSVCEWMQPLQKSDMCCADKLWTQFNVSKQWARRGWPNNQISFKKIDSNHNSFTAIFGYFCLNTEILGCKP